jgi:hypothetical protein
MRIFRAVPPASGGAWPTVRLLGDGTVRTATLELIGHAARIDQQIILMNSRQSLDTPERGRV